MNEAGHQEPHINVRERHREHAVPGPCPVPRVGTIEQHHDLVPNSAGTNAREAIDPATHQVSERMAGEAVQAQQDDIHQQDNRSKANEEMPMEHERPHHVDPEKQEDDQAQQQEIPVEVIQHPGESGLAVVAAALQLLDGAGRRVPEKRPKVGLAVVIAAAAQPQRDRRKNGDEDREDWDADQAKPQPGREEGGDVGIKLDVDLVEYRPGGVDHEGGIRDDREGRLDPPGPAW